ncbi:MULTISPECIES: hypothetical protein [unclassified Pseudoclavibacter]|uniref:hypothetical protein n=1 Tax=unclassified Pseudoclavibacter TaxID=2615177 RepID=UPI001BA9ECC1|nr:hypothetical protein [Pseudoclavibacter sp. Marseille-Q4354]MBS3180010.1 hypothetical protein [Pseudoclavibacter sp. Marseille-Q4354]
MEAAQIEQRHRDRLNEFTRRARRVWAHSLSQNVPQLVAYSRAQMKMHIEVRDGVPVPTSIDVETPPEEQLESLAARLRPFTLDQEDVLLTKVMKSLEYLGAGILSDEDSERSALRRKSYSEALKSESYSVEHQDGDVLKPRVTNLQLAEAWLYGDVVHNSVDRHTDAMSYGIRERFEGASAHYSRIALFTLEVLMLVLKYRVELGISEESLTLPVVMSEVPDKERQQIRFSIAEIGTPMPEAGMGPLGPEWRAPTVEDLGLPDSEGSATET